MPFLQRIHANLSKDGLLILNESILPTIDSRDDMCADFMRYCFNKDNDQNLEEFCMKRNADDKETRSKKHPRITEYLKYCDNK